MNPNPIHTQPLCVKFPQVAGRFRIKNSLRYNLTSSRVQHRCTKTFKKTPDTTTREFYLLYKSRFGVFMLILYSLQYTLHWSTRKAKKSVLFHCTFYHEGSIWDETQTKSTHQTNPCLHVVSMFHHVSSTSASKTLEHSTDFPTSTAHYIGVCAASPTRSPSSRLLFPMLLFLESAAIHGISGWRGSTNRRTSTCKCIQRNL